MPRRKVTRKKFTENDLRNEKLEALLKQFDMEVNRRVYEMQRATEQACAHIDSKFKLALLKMPSAVRKELWENNKKDQGAGQEEKEMTVKTAESTETLSAVDAMLGEAERAVRHQKRAGRGQTGGRTTRARPSSASSSDLATPMLPPRPLHFSTPAVTPKFDPLTVRRQAPSTIRRHRPEEVLMSLKGSPVMLDSAAESAAFTEAKQLMQQTSERLRLDVQLDDETKQVMASLRDQLINLTSSVNAVI